MEVQVVSRKLLAPSPPSDHPRKVKLSSIDQLAPPIFVDSIFYYASTGKDDGARVERLEKSLGETVAVFYPLAGRYDQENVSIECNDKGVELLEARVTGQLEQLLQQDPPDANLVSELVAPHVRHSATTPLVSVQVNMFECGGLAVGLKVSHLVADAYTISLFANEWAGACRSGSNGGVVRPSFNLASIFPPGDVCKAVAELHPSCPGCTVVTRRFVFDGKAIAGARGSSGGSRVEVVTGVVWGGLMRVGRGRRRPSLMTHAFNMRGRTGVRVPQYSCGNLWRLVLAWFEPGQEEPEPESLVREALAKAGAECRSLSSPEGLLAASRNSWRESGEAKLYKEGVDVYDFTSWCGMRHYQVDFGWGQPCWVSSVKLPVDGLVVFLDTKDGRGIEAWVSLAQHKMLAFQQDEHILAITQHLL